MAVIEAVMGWAVDFESEEQSEAEQAEQAVVVAPG